MDAHESYRAGDLSGAIELQRSFVREHPRDIPGRSFLFALLCFAGELESAERQIEALGALDPKVEHGVAAYRQLLLADAHRAAVYRGEASPILPPEPPADLTLRASALEAQRRGETTEAARLLDEAAESSPLLSGKIDGESFDAIRDSDDLLASVLEVYAAGRYLWFPLAQVRHLEPREPKTVADLLWQPASLVDADQNEVSVCIPAVYEGSHPEAADPLLRLGRSTVWVEVEGLGARGLGRRLFLTYQGDTESEVDLLKVKNLEISGD